MMYTSCEKCRTPLTSSDLIIRFEEAGHPRDATCPRCGHVRRLTRMEACEATMYIIERGRAMRDRGLDPTLDRSDRTAEARAIRKEAEKEAKLKMEQKAVLPETPLLESVPEIEPAPIPTETITKPLKKSTLDTWM